MQYTVHICGYLGVVISQLPPRRVHTGKCTTAILAELIRMIGCYPFEVPNDDDNSQGRSVRMPIKGVKQHPTSAAVKPW